MTTIRSNATRSEWAPGALTNLGRALRAGRTPGGLTMADARGLGLFSIPTGSRTPDAPRKMPSPAVTPAHARAHVETQVPTTRAIPAVARRRRERIVAACRPTES